MKKTFFAALVVAVVTAVAGYNMSQGQDDVQLTDLQMANIEALADVAPLPNPVYWCCGNVGDCFKIVGGGTVRGIRLLSDCP
jgi:hypothetical protein